MYSILAAPDYKVFLFFFIKKFSCISQDSASHLFLKHSKMQNFFQGIKIKLICRNGGFFLRRRNLPKDTEKIEFIEILRERRVFIRGNSLFLTVFLVSTKKISPLTQNGLSKTKKKP